MEMTVDGFLAKLFTLYPFDNKSAQAWITEYKRVLTDDFALDAVYDKMIRTYSGATAPKPAWFEENKITKAQAKSREAAEKAVEETSSSKYIEFKNLWAYHPGHKCWYEYGVEPQIGEYATKQALMRIGFTQITDKNPKC